MPDQQTKEADNANIIICLRALDGATNKLIVFVKRTIGSSKKYVFYILLWIRYL